MKTHGESILHENVNSSGYLKLDADIAHELELHKGTKSPSYFKEDKITRRDSSKDKASLTRSAFGRDIEKIINVPAYNRYADKTQVFSFVQNDDICRRGLHVQLVSRIARNIGSALGLNCELIEAIALGHDVGHTPFGHAGERFLNKIYHAHTKRYFNHNVHSVRVLDKLYRRNISLQTLDGVLCHNGEFAQQILETGSLSTFDELDSLVEACNRDESTIKTLRPSTLEGCVVRVSDMIAYIGKDRQDAIDMGILKSLECFDSEVIGVTNTKIIHNLTVDIINNSFGKDRIMMSKAVFEDLKLAKQQNYQYIYLNEGVISGIGNIVEEMFSEMFEQLLRDCVSENQASPLFKHHVSNLTHKSESITEEKYLQEEPSQIVVDYMASMTDSYFTALYEFLFPESSKRIISRGYCEDLRESDSF